MGKLFGLVQLFFLEFSKASFIEQAGIVGTIVTVFSPFLFFFWRKYRLHDIEIQELDGLCKTRAELIRKQKQEIEKQTKINNDQRAWFLDVRLIDVKKERDQGNEERAINILQTGVEAIRPDLAICCHELALHHLSLCSDYGVDHLLESERMARMAVLLCPSDQESHSLLEEILMLESEAEYSRSNYLTSDTLWDEAVDSLKIKDDSKEAIKALANTAEKYHKSGRYRFSERLYRRAAIISYRVNGSHHKNTLILKSSQASALGRTGKYSDALELLKDLLPEFEKVFGKENQNTLSSRSHIAVWTDDANQALALFKTLLPDQEKVLGKEHPDVLTTRSNIAIRTGEVGDANQALALFKALLPDREKVLGKEHPDVLTTRSNIATWSGETGNDNQALELFKALLPDREKVLGKEHPNTLLTHSKIAFWTGETGDAKQALALFKALLPDLENVIGKEHPNTLLTRGSIATWTGKTGDAKQALALSKALLPDQEKVLGKEHPDVLDTLKRIKDWQSIVDGQ